MNTIHLAEGSGIAENSKNTITVYPNPFSDIATITFGQELKREHAFVIYDLLGTEVYRLTNIASKQIEINYAEIGNGFYFSSVFNTASNEMVFAKKIIAE